jgi:hypothetical protein
MMRYASIPQKAQNGRLICSTSRESVPRLGESILSSGMCTVRDRKLEKL